MAILSHLQDAWIVIDPRRRRAPELDV